MHVRTGWSVSVCALALALVAGGNVHARRVPAAPAWLLGDWVLCHDPDNSPKDVLHFESGESGMLVSGVRRHAFLYRIRGEQVEASVRVKERAIPITLRMVPARDRLEVHDADSGSVATYVRTDGPLAARCTIR